ncbi:MAG TPA: cupin domain-containing protein [Micropepsaceae bacterium]|nr:cupin domain-containing protein [Micropepsaceae bacterium]
MASKPIALVAADAAPRKAKSNYPEKFASRLGERVKRPLGDPFGLTIFGVNITTLPRGAMSALRHAHTKQDEFIYILEGTPTLITDSGETILKPGMCAGFKAGSGDAHHLVNRSQEDVLYLEVGDRTLGDEVHYPDDDIVAVKTPDGTRKFTRKDGTPY